MKFFSFVAFLLFILAGITFTQAQESAVWQVTKYDISATLPNNVTDRNLSAKSVVSLKNIGRGAGAAVTFRINAKAEITAAQIAEASATYRKIADDKLAGLQRFTVNLPNSVQPGGTIAVSISYRLSVTENNGLNAISEIGSQFLPLSVWYPTPNNPYNPRGADFAPFNLQVAAQNGQSVVSSGNASGNNYQQTLNAQPFLVTGNWETLEIPELGKAEAKNSLIAFLAQGVGAEQKQRAAELLKLTAQAKTFLVDLFGSNPTSAGGVKIVAVRRGAGFCDGGTILLDEAAFRRAKLDRSTAMTIVEALAKVWLGNANIVSGEGYGALREGLARFIATQFVEKHFGKETADVERLRQRTSYVAVARRDDDLPLALNSPSIQTYFASVPNKSAMIWRLVAREMGEDKFYAVVRAQLQSGRGENLTLAKLRNALVQAGGEQVQTILDYGFDKQTDLDLLVGVAQSRGAESAVALRNTGGVPVRVNVTATTQTGERLTTTANVAAKNFGEAVFKTNAKIARVEIDPDKFYPQLDYANDIAPREITENDLLANITVAFNRQDFVKAEAIARAVLNTQPRFDEARTWLGRAILEQNRLDEAEKEFNLALNEKLLAPRTLAWANIGLGEIALRRNQNANAAKFFDEAVKADAEYASNLVARQGRLKAEPAPIVDENAKTFFAAFDKAVLTARKAEVNNLILSGEIAQFSDRLTSGQPSQWQTKVARTEILDANRMTAEINLNATLLNKEASSGTALFTLVRTGNAWKLADVDLFEVR